jgi:hypothetical protein
VFEQQHAPPALSRSHRAHQAGRSCADDHYVERFHRDRIILNPVDLPVCRGAC